MQPIPYSPIVTRPKLKWPNGARIALWLVPNIEHYEYLPRQNQARDPWPRMPHPDVLGYSRADYGNRVGYWRMVEVIDRYEIPCTVSLNLAVYEHFPEIMEECEAPPGRYFVTVSTTRTISGICLKRTKGRLSKIALRPPNG